MKSPLVRWLLALNILILCGVLFAFFGQRHRHQQAQRTLADKMVQKGWQGVAPTERAQLDGINESVVKGRSLTDDQFSFLMTEASSLDTKKTATVCQMTADAILEIMHYKMKAPLSASQKAMFSNRLVSLLQVPDPTDNSVFTMTEMHKLEACHLLALYDVREAIPQIVPLLDDPKAKVRNDAKQALKQLGYST
jgi:hypothetical protein